MTATERLRELLDERGVFWIDIPLVNMKRTCWKSSDEQDGYCYFDEDAFGVMELTVTSITPEQAIAATLGSGTCKQEEHGWSTEGDHARVWLTCGHDCMVETVADLPNYCPQCGRRVEVNE